MAALCWLLEHLLVAQPLNRLLLDLIKQHPSREVEGITEPLGTRLRAGIPAWQWWVSGVSEPRVHCSIVLARYITARLRANPGLFQENVLVTLIFTD